MASSTLQAHWVKRHSVVFSDFRDQALPEDLFAEEVADPADGASTQTAAASSEPAALTIANIAKVHTTLVAHHPSRHKTLISTLVALHICT